MILENHGLEPILEAAFVLVLGVGHEQQEEAAVGEARTGTDAFVVGQGALGEVEGGAELGEQLLLQELTWLLTLGVDQIELHMDKGADVELGSAYLTLEDNETTVVEGDQAADAQGGLSLLALDGWGVGAVQVLTDGLEVITEALEAQEIGNLVGDGRLLSVALQGVLGGGPEQMGVGIIGECLEAAVVVGVGKRLGDVQTAPCGLSVESVLADLSVGLAREEQRLCVRHVADSLLVACRLVIGHETIVAHIQDGSCGGIGVDGEQTEARRGRLIVDNGIAVGSEPCNTTIVTSGHVLTEMPLFVEYRRLGRKG